MSTKVRVHSLIMADRIIEEKDGRYGVIGMFSSITLEENPGQGQGKATLTIHPMDAFTVT